MKLLFDQNLPPRLSRLLSDLYPGSIHVREVGLKEAPDGVIWEYARIGGFIVVSKDADFQQRSLLYGHPPKFIWLRVRNCPAALIHEVLRTHSVALHTFEGDMEESHLMLP